MKIAEIILEQLGGNKFIRMTGARNLVGDTNSLSLIFMILISAA